MMQFLFLYDLENSLKFSSEVVAEHRDREMRGQLGFTYPAGKAYPKSDKRGEQEQKSDATQSRLSREGDPENDPLENDSFTRNIWVKLYFMAE
jgi:hypothetical protein